MSRLSEEHIRTIVEERFKPIPCPKCGEALWKIDNIQMPNRTMKMLNLRIIKCAACGHTSEW